MNKPSKEELEKLIEKARPIIRDSTTTIDGFQEESKPQCSYLGTGTFYRDGGDLFILTAKHVVDKAHKYQHVFYSCGSEGKPFPFRGAWVGHPVKEVDLAIWGCFSESIENTSIIPLAANIFTQTDFSAYSLFFCEGFPGAQLTYLPFLRESTLCSLPIVGQQRKPRAHIDEKIHFSIGYDADIPPHGISGSSVWDLNLHRVSSLEEWKPEMITFAGVVQRWDPNGKCLIATKADLIRPFILEAMKITREMWNEIEKPKS